MPSDINCNKTMRIANAPCSWGVLEFGLDGPAADFSVVLDEMMSAGYTGTELGDWGFMPTTAGRLTEELTLRKLALVGAFVPVAFALPDALSDGRERALRTARLLADACESGTRLILADDNGTVPLRTELAGRIRPEHGLGEDQWLRYADAVNDIARAVTEETGLRVAFHHHCGGFVETPEEISRLLELSDSEVVGLCFDTGHYEFGGGRATEGVDLFSDRIIHVHFKDYDPSVAESVCKENLDYFQAVRAGVFCELGRGRVDFDGILRRLAGSGYDGWIVVEQDVLPGMGTPLESARRNREFLKTIGY
jgi:inosose dehydratase